MQEQQVNTGYDRGSFFGRAPRARSSDSSGLSIIQFFWGLSLMSVARALNIPNPFTFIQNNTLFSLFTNPIVTANDHYLGWPAYASLVNAVVNGEAGPIKQMSGNHYLPTLEWFVAACDLDIKLDTNGTETGSAPFLEMFNKLVANDTALFDARSRSHEECHHTTTTEMVLSTIFSLLMIFLLALAVRCACLAVCRARDRVHYEVILDARPSPAATASSLKPYLAQPAAEGSTSEKNDDVDSDEEAALKPKR